MTYAALVVAVMRELNRRRKESFEAASLPNESVIGAVVVRVEERAAILKEWSQAVPPGQVLGIPLHWRVRGEQPDAVAFVGGATTLHVNVACRGCGSLDCRWPDRCGGRGR